MPRTHTHAPHTHSLQHSSSCTHSLSYGDTANTPFFAPLRQCMCEYRPFPSSEHHPLPQIALSAFDTDPRSSRRKGGTHTGEISHQNLPVHKRPPIQLFSRLSLFRRPENTPASPKHSQYPPTHTKHTSTYEKCLMKTLTRLLLSCAHPVFFASPPATVQFRTNSSSKPLTSTPHMHAH